jgi:hypothetical protein
MVNNRSSVDPRMLRAVKVPLRGMETATISLIAPNSVDLDDTDWTPWLNNLSNTSSVYWSGEAQVAVFRQTLNTFMPVGSITQIRSVRFTVVDDGFPNPVRKGDRVVVTACPTAPDLRNYQYTITSAITGSLPFSHDIEAEADMGVYLDAGEHLAGYGLSPYGFGGFGE